MKFFRIFVSFLFFVALVTAGLSFMLPAYQKVNRSISINASAPTIYEPLTRLENFNRFSVWTQQDSSAVYTLTGKDGTVGAATSWQGSPLISGDGRIEITELVPNQKVAHAIEFSKPKKGKANSVFQLRETNREQTTVDWTFTIATPRPWNIFNLFYSVDKQLGKDFEDGLSALKKMIEMRSMPQ